MDGWPRADKLRRDPVVTQSEDDPLFAEPASRDLLLSFLRWLVIARFLLHAFSFPVFEGPDEPFHLARTAAFADGGMVEGLRGERVDASIVAAIASHPCGEDLANHFGCPGFDGSGALFNILEPAVEHVPGEEAFNYEAHQPPLYYMATAPLLLGWSHLASEPGATSPEKRLLVLRIANVVLVAWALLGPLRSIGRLRGRRWEVAVLWLLLVPGAVESLARASNDTAVFLWCALLVAALERDGRRWRIYLLVALGPLLKLTAVPVVVYAVGRIGSRHGWRPASVALALSGLVVPFQLLRGWAWGGTLELAALGKALDQPPWEVAVGVLHSAYTFVKTAFWLGGWSVFKPPFWLVAVGAVLGLTWLLALRPETSSGTRYPHLAGLLAAAAGFVAFAIGKWGVFEVWGAVGGWYAWGWLPWLGLAASDLARVRTRYSVQLYAVSMVWILVANGLWLATVLRIY